MTIAIISILLLSFFASFPLGNTQAAGAALLEGVRDALRFAPELAAALCLLLLHERARPRRLDGLIAKLSSAALGVFLLHTTVWGWLIAPAAGLLSPLPQKWAFVNVLLSALVITALCIPVDLLRAWLFEKFGLRRLADRAQGKIFALCARLVSPK